MEKRLSVSVFSKLRQISNLVSPAISGGMAEKLLGDCAYMADLLEPRELVLLALTEECMRIVVNALSADLSSLAQSSFKVNEFLTHAMEIYQSNLERYKPTPTQKDRDGLSFAGEYQTDRDV